MVQGSPIKHSSNNNGKGIDDPSKSSSSGYFNSKSYSFNGRVIIGIGIIMGIALIITLYIGTISQSQQIRLSLTSLPSYLLPSLFSDTANNQISASSLSNLHSSSINNNRIILIQQDFGWNGTYGGPPIIVNKGDKIQLVVINRGHMAHNFGIGILPKQVSELVDKDRSVTLEQRVNNLPYDTMSAMPCPGCKMVYEQAHINLFMKPGTQQTTTFVADKPGHFNYFCMVRGHLWLGMIGDLIVRENPGSTTSNNSTTTI